MLNRELKRIKQNDIVCYIEIAGYGEGNVPRYEIKRGWYLGTYFTRVHPDGLHIITAYDNIDCCVVRHVSTHLVFDEMEDAVAVLELLELGEISYEKV